MLNGRVNYTHDGSETREDSFDLQIQHDDSIGGSRRLIRGFSYALPIRIEPVNDAPEIRLPTGSVLRLAQNSR